MLPRDGRALSLAIADAFGYALVLLIDAVLSVQ